MPQIKTFEDFQSGQVLLFDKPLHWTSFDLVNRVRIALCKYFGVKKLKVGHAGTLDPLATGLLIICTGKMTKQIESLQAQHKVYSGTFMVGATTPSYDLESEVDHTYPTDHIDDQLLENAVKMLSGSIEQYPPIFSAVKKDGKRAYDLARQGIAMEMKPRNVEILSFDIDAKSMPEISFHISCSKGTYIRSMAHDFGKALHSGAYLKSLRREAIGDYSVTDAYQLQDFLSMYTKSKLPIE